MTSSVNGLQCSQEYPCNSLTGGSNEKIGAKIELLLSVVKT
jgi:hypothetical protein